MSRSALLLSLATVAVLGFAPNGCSPRAPAAPAAQVDRRWPEHLAHSVAAVGFPGAQRAFQVGPGASVWTGELALRWSLPGDSSARVTPISFEEDAVPIAHVGILGVRESVAVEAAAIPNAALGDSSLALSVRVSVAWRAADAGECSLALDVSDVPPAGSVPAWDAQVGANALAWSKGQPASGGRMIARLPTPSTTSEVGRNLRATWHRRLGPGERAEWDFSIPLYPLPAGAGFSPRPHERQAADVRARWRELIGRATEVRTGEPRYDALLRASLVTLLTCEERWGAGLVPIGNPFQYRDVWLRDGARAVRALALAGQRNLAADAVRAFTRFQRPSGALISQRGQLDGTGQALWAFEQAASHPPDPSLARALLPAALGGVRWLRAASESTWAMRLPWPGLLPFGDPRDNELVRAPLVGNDAWAIAGAEATARLARLAGDAAAGDESVQLAAALRERFAMALARVHSADVPPSWPGVGRDWGNFAVSYPTRVLPPSHPRVRALVARGLARGLARYGPPDSLHAYLGSDLAMSALLDGHGQVALAYVDSLLARSSSTLGQAEIFSGTDGGFGGNLPPHATAAATVFDLLHALVAVEDGDTLVLGAGLSARSWAGAGIERAPTRFGTLSAAFERSGDDHWRVHWQGVSAPVRVRVPLELTLARVIGQGEATPDGRWIVTRPDEHAIEFETAPGRMREPRP